MGIVVPLLLISLTCLVIWRACDGFEFASAYLGRHLSDGVRGGTINAIASSVPELLTTLIALLVLDDARGFALGIGTTAGSALFNGMIIPALSILLVVGMMVQGRRVRYVGVQPKVILRDGLWLLACEFLLVLCLNGTSLGWKEGLLLTGLYGAYLLYSLRTMAAPVAGTGAIGSSEASAPTRSAPERAFYWATLGPLLDLERHLVKVRHRRRIEAGQWNAWPLLLLSTAVIAVACWGLVHATEWLGEAEYVLFGQVLHGLGMPTIFVAVIFASMATSVPDTIISIRDARRGAYDDAVANALGSNIFDICFALGFPLFLYTALYGNLEMDPEVAARSTELRLLLLALTIVGFAAYYCGRRARNEWGQTVVALGRPHAFALLGLYAAFATYIFGLAAGQPWARALEVQIESFAELLPQLKL